MMNMLVKMIFYYMFVFGEIVDVMDFCLKLSISW